MFNFQRGQQIQPAKISVFLSSAQDSFRPFASDTSSKCIDGEGLGLRRRTGTRQVSFLLKCFIPGRTENISFNLTDAVETVPGTRRVLFYSQPNRFPEQYSRRWLYKIPVTIVVFLFIYDAGRSQSFLASFRRPPQPGGVSITVVS